MKLLLARLTFVSLKVGITYFTYYHCKEFVQGMYKVVEMYWG